MAQPDAVPAPVSVSDSVWQDAGDQDGDGDGVFLLRLRPDGAVLPPGASPGASTTPIYQAFGSMEGLVEAVRDEVNRILLGYLTRPLTGGRFLDIGAGYALFAREEPRLFRSTFLESVSESFDARRADNFARLVKQMAEEPALAEFAPAQRERLLTRMWIFTHGLAALVATGALTLDQDEIVQVLDEVGSQMRQAMIPEDGTP